MYVVVQHRVSNPAAFAERGGRMIQDVPASLRAHFFLPSEDTSTAVCLWEGDSVEAVREYIDGRLEDASRNEYFAVDAQHALGLPSGSRAGA